MADCLPRVMWLLNHKAAWQFELAMLKKIGFREFFLPKGFPQEITFRSAAVDFSEDASLTIPAADLSLMNETDWHSETPRAAWDVANRHFDIVFCMTNPVLTTMSRWFGGAAVLRAYGLPKNFTYSSAIASYDAGRSSIETMGKRFWFGAAYRGLADLESPWMRSREVYLPLGLNDCRVRDDWSGEKAAILFICPDIEGLPYYAGVYRNFKEMFPGFPYSIGGAQALATSDLNVLGFLPEEQHQRNMREYRVMFYHSTEPHHVHYHPFEAVRAGMPLVFMAGGMLDKLGGADLPGRCRNGEEARAMISRLLGGDRGLIDRIRAAQPALLDAMRFEVLEPHWRKGMAQIVEELERARSQRPLQARRAKIAVVVPVAYRGGTLRSAKATAKAVWEGSRQTGEDADVILAYSSDEDEAADRARIDEWDAGLPSVIGRRPIGWQILDAETARRAMRYAGHPSWIPSAEHYMVPDDGVENLCDCDLWIVASDRLKLPLLPIKPYLMLVYDYIQRYDPSLAGNISVEFIAAARAARRVLVTTRFTESDALTFAGLSRKMVVRVPMLIAQLPEAGQNATASGEPYFLWTTNLGPHKNHPNALAALRDYYELFEGSLACHICGVGSASLLNGDNTQSRLLQSIVSGSKQLSRKLRILGELPDHSYARAIAGAAFLWHPARIDNGTLAAVEAASCGVPCLSSRYPAMEEMDERFNLHLNWMDPSEPAEIAQRLKWMEAHSSEARAALPARDRFRRHTSGESAAYWSVVRECL
jgi:glycosyltransferase involved in cell wall biosynthesis